MPTEEPALGVKLKRVAVHQQHCTLGPVPASELNQLACAGTISDSCLTIASPPLLPALFIGQEYWEGDDGSGVATEDDDNADMEAGEYACNFLEVVLRRLWEGRFGRRRMMTKTTEMSIDNKHEEDVMTRLMSEMFCKGEPSSSSSTACLKHRLLATTAARAGRADPPWTKGSRTGQGPWQ